MNDITTARCITRNAANPILTKKDVPYESELTYNVGVIKWQGRYVMTFRNDYGANEKDFDDLTAGRRSTWPSLRSNIGLAFSTDGVKWEVQKKENLHH